MLNERIHSGQLLKYNTPIPCWPIISRVAYIVIRLVTRVNDKSSHCREYTLGIVITSAVVKFSPHLGEGFITHTAQITTNHQSSQHPSNSEIQKMTKNDCIFVLCIVLYCIFFIIDWPNLSPCPPTDSIIALMTVWRITGKIIRTTVMLIRPTYARI